LKKNYNLTAKKDKNDKIHYPDPFSAQNQTRKNVIKNNQLESNSLVIKENDLNKSNSIVKIEEAGKTKVKTEEAEKIKVMANKMIDVSNSLEMNKKINNQIQQLTTK